MTHLKNNNLPIDDLDGKWSKMKHNKFNIMYV